MGNPDGLRVARGWYKWHSSTVEPPSLCAENYNVRHFQMLPVCGAGSAECFSWPGKFPFFSYQICEFMYERQLRYDRIIGCYLRDPLRKVSNSGSRGLSASWPCSLSCWPHWAQLPCSSSIITLKMPSTVQVSIQVVRTICVCLVERSWFLSFRVFLYF